MRKDEVWQQLKRDKTMVYGEPIMNQFLKLAQRIDKHHWDELSAEQRKLVEPQTRLNFAATVKEAEQAIKDGADDLNSAFEHAAVHGHIEIVELLVKKGAGTYTQALPIAARGGHVPIIKFLVKKGTQDLDLALATAAIYGHTEACSFLVDKGASRISTAIACAANNGHEKTSRVLIEKEKPSQKHMEAILQAAATKGHLPVVKLLVDNGAKDLNKALHLAANGGHLDVTKFLVEKGADDLKGAYLDSTGPSVWNYLKTKIEEEK
jgi:ankyrin repeat protein